MRNSKLIIILAAAILYLSQVQCKVQNILDFGAIPDDDSLKAEQVNAQAFMDALVAANYTTDGTEREVLVPSGHTFGMMAVWGDEFTNITITIDGNIKASKRFNKWPTNGNSVRNFMDFNEIHNVIFRGVGTVDGQGYMWWIREYLSLNHKGRPHLFRVNGATNIEIFGIRWQNSPQFHILVEDVDTLYCHDFEIYTDYKGQFELGLLFLGGDSSGFGGLNGMTLPTFPLNTDGIDPSGKNILIERVNITNYDDAVAVKPSNNERKYATCSENIIVRDCNVNFGVGMTIGSVPARDYYNCVRNVQFLNIKMYHPFKGIYVKTNPGETSSMLPGSGGEITNILYDGFEIHYPIWWSIYIGPQQQNQPGQVDATCGLIYPLGNVPCDTQPLINMNGIVLRNINVYGNLLIPGIIRCNETNPCTGFVMQNVNDDSLWTKLGFNYIVENVQGDVTNSFPIPAYTNLDGIPANEESQVSLASLVADHLYPVIERIILDFMKWNSEDQEDDINEQKFGSGFKQVADTFAKTYKLVAF